MDTDRILEPPIAEITQSLWDPGFITLYGTPAQIFMLRAYQIDFSIHADTVK
jgi:hypothetical protein